MVLWQTWAGIYLVEYRLGGKYIGRIFLDYNNPGGNFPGGSYPGWELSWLGVFQVGVILAGNFPGGSYPGWELSGLELSWLGIFFGGGFASGIFWGESSGWEFSRWEFS